MGAASGQSFDEQNAALQAARAQHDVTFRRETRERAHDRFAVAMEVSLVLVMIAAAVLLAAAMLRFGVPASALRDDVVIGLYGGAALLGGGGAVLLFGGLYALLAGGEARALILVDTETTSVPASEPGFADAPLAEAALVAVPA